MQANETDFGPHVKDIAEALENKLDEATIVEELRQYVENYGIDLATAKEAIVRKHYGDPRTLQASAFLPLANIKADESSVSFRAKIVSVFSKEINLKDGSQKTIFEGEIADGSATLRFTVWRDEFTAEPGDRTTALVSYAHVCTSGDASMCVSSRSNSCSDSRESRFSPGASTTAET